MADHTEAPEHADGKQVDVDLVEDPHPAPKADALQGDQQDVTAEEIDPGRDEEAEKAKSEDDVESIATPFPEPGHLTNEQRKEQIKGLISERRGYELYGNEDQVAAVDAELKRLGHSGKSPSKRATTRHGDDTKGGKQAATRTKK